MNNGSSTDALIARLGGRNRVDAFEAAKQVWNVDANAMATRLLNILRSGRRPFNRSAAAHALQMVSTPSVIAALERTVRNKAEAPDVRGHAAETLAHRHRRSTHELMLRQLLDPSKHVRFWCAFALGQMEERAALDLLRALLSDNRKVHGFHTVAKEAADTIHIIENRKLGRRCPFCIRTP
jgi:HEAT repeat protein